MDIFLQINGNKEGPFTTEEIRKRLDSGVLPVTTLGWYEGLSNWLPIMAVIAPRARPPAFREQSSPELPTSFDWKALLQLVVKNQSWNTQWVRLLLAFVGFLTIVRALSAQGEFTGTQTAFLLIMTWTAMWVMASLFVFKRIQVSVRKASALVCVTVAASVLMFLLASKVSFIGSVFQTSSSYSVLKRSFGCLFVSLLQQVLVLAPIWYCFVKRQHKTSSSALVLYGVLSGMAIGLTPALTNILQSKWYSLSGNSFGILDDQSLLMSFLWPLLTGIWSGIGGSFLALGIRSPETAKNWMIASMVVPSLLCALYLAFSVSIVGILSVAVSILCFATFATIHKG